MDVFPQDLGSHWHVALVRTRTPERRRGLARLLSTHAPPGDGKNDASSAKPLGPIGRFWTGGTNVAPAAATSGLAALMTRTGPLSVLMGAGFAALLGGAVVAASGGPVELAVLTAGEGAFLASLGLFVPRFLFRRAHKTPLSASEIEALLPIAPDELDRTFLTLVLDVIRQPEATIPNEARAALRDALSALAEAIQQLPPAYAAFDGAAQLQPESLRSEAGRVRAEAEQEPDAVSAASLARQADALLRRADAQERSATLLRRASVLRSEMIAQTEALRAGLAGFHAGQTDVTGLADLADVARRVAGEATSVARARDELDAGAVAAPAAPPAVAVQQVGRS